MINLLFKFTGLFSRIIASVGLVLVLSTNTSFAQKIFTSTVNEDYTAAKTLFDRNKVQEARTAWNNIVKHRGYELSGKQRGALSACIKKCDGILHKRREASTSNLTRAETEILNAKPLLKAALPLDVNEKEEYLNEALTYLKKTTTQEKKGVKYNALSAHCYLNLDVPEIAKPFIDKALAITGNDTYSLNLQSQYYYLSDQYNDALNSAQMSLKADAKTNDDAWYWMVKTLLEMGDRESLKKGWKYVKRAIADDDKIATEFQQLVPTQKHRDWLEQYGREIATTRAKKEREALLAGGASVRTVSKRR